MSENYGGTKNCIDWLTRFLKLTMLNKINDTYHVSVKCIDDTYHIGSGSQYRALGQFTCYSIWYMSCDKQLHTSGGYSMEMDMDTDTDSDMDWIEMYTIYICQHNSIAVYMRAYLSTWHTCQHVNISVNIKEHQNTFHSFWNILNQTSMPQCDDFDLVFLKMSKLPAVTYLSPLG